MKTYLFSYHHNGDMWSLEIQADSVEDAKARVKRLSYATYDGELIAKVPAVAGVWVRLIVAVRNWWRE